MHLRCAGLAAADGADLQGRVEHLVEHRHHFGMVGGQPSCVVEWADRSVRRSLEVLETTVQPGEPFAGESVLDEAGERIEEGLEVRLADQRRSVAVVVQHRRHAGRIDRQGDAVHPHAVRARMLTGDDRRSRRHAHDGLRMGAFVANTLGGETVDHRSPGDGAAVAAERVVALLIGGDEEDLAAHQCASSRSFDSICRASSSSAPAVAPPIVSAIARGSQSVE